MTEKSLFSDAAHHQWLGQEARRQFDFFRTSLNPAGGFFVLGYDGAPLAQDLQELHTAPRMVHSYVLGKRAGLPDCDGLIDQGVQYLLNSHRDKSHGGYVWGVSPEGVQDGRKLAYGHVFTLLAAAAAKSVGHPDADRLLADVDQVLDTYFWDDSAGRLKDEWNRDWTPFSTYRGLNANMHGTEAMLTAFEVTGNQKYLDRAGRILGFFFEDIAPAHGWRLPEHYSEDWQVDTGYSGNPMFRPAGTTPGHSFELGRLMLQHWDLCGRPEGTAYGAARQVIYRALADGWNSDIGGLVYTLKFDGTPDVRNRYWWPVTEAIGALSALLKVDPQPEDAVWYAKLWAFAQKNFIDPDHGGWFPEIDTSGKPDATQFEGKPDIYHSIQATVLPLAVGISNMYDGVDGVLRR